MLAVIRTFNGFLSLIIFIKDTIQLFYYEIGTRIVTNVKHETNTNYYDGIPTCDDNNSVTIENRCCKNDERSLISKGSKINSNEVI